MWTAKCSVGYIESVTPTYYRNRECVACEVGKEQLSPGITHVFQPTECTTCVAGYTDFDFDSATACERCSPGTFQPSTGYTGPCSECSPDTRDHDIDAATGCQTCPNGFHSGFGATACSAIRCHVDRLNHSTTVCSGSTHDVCMYECERGYERVGQHHCQPNGRAAGVFVGGSCEALPCTTGYSLPHSPTVCRGETDAFCDFVCEAGYHPSLVTGQSEAGALNQGRLHCAGNGSWVGGICVPDDCEDLEIDPQSPTRCAGTYGAVCELECPSGWHV
eukprot:SAG31_NODE_13615_length_857_cov_1.197889_1_plen_275_part_01